MNYFKAIWKDSGEYLIGKIIKITRQTIFYHLIYSYDEIYHKENAKYHRLGREIAGWEYHFYKDIDDLMVSML